MKSFMIIAIFICALGLNIAYAADYSDLGNDPNAAFIKYFANKKFVGGFPDGTIRPNAKITRAEAVNLALVAIGIQRYSTGNKTSFADVPTTHWAAQSISTASKEGYIAGYTDKTFRPDQPLTRAEGISFILSLTKKELPNVDIPTIQIKDVPKGSWAANPIAIGLYSGMVYFKDKKTRKYAPDTLMTRGEFIRALGVFITSHPNFFATPLKPQLKVVYGEVEIRNTSRTVVKKGQIYTVKIGDTVTTRPTSSAEINLPDGSGLLMKENTILKLNAANGRIYIKNDGTEGIAVEGFNVQLSMGKIFGALATNINETDFGGEKVTAQLINIFQDTNPLVASMTNSPLSNKSNNKTTFKWWKQTKTKRVKVKVDMPWGLAAIKGTFWQNDVDMRGRSTTSLLTGLAEITAGGKTVVAGAGQKTVANPRKKILSQPYPMGATEKESWSNEKDWTTKKSKQIEENKEINLFYIKTTTSPPIYDKGNIVYGTGRQKYIMPLHQEVPGW